LEAAVHNREVGLGDFSHLKVAFIHYWLVTWRGGEKVIHSMMKLFPKSDVYTLFYDPSACQPFLEGKTVYSSRLDTPFLRKHYQKIFPLYPLGIKSLQLNGQYDLIISSESGPAKGIGNPDRIPHLCYVHTPMRYCWGFSRTYIDSMPKFARGIARWRFRKLREWDATTVNNVDFYVANSKNVVNRINKYYNKEAKVCYPPISLDLFENELVESKREHYLSLGALTPYKNIGLLIETFNKNGKKLIVVGTGSEKAKLERLAKHNIKFMGSLPLKKVIKHIRHSKALVFPGEEDFGMVPLEVMSQGTPVIAYKKGGALETVVEDRSRPEISTGVFFEQSTSESLTEALDYFEANAHQFDRERIREHARKFGEDRFHRTISGYILELLNRNKK